MSDEYTEKESEMAITNCNTVYKAAQVVTKINKELHKHIEMYCAAFYKKFPGVDPEECELEAELKGSAFRYRMVKYTPEEISLKRENEELREALVEVGKILHKNGIVVE